MSIDTETGEANLHTLTDNVYFDDLNNHRVEVYDADGNPLTGIYDDVVDLRAEKEAGLL